MTTTGIIFDIKKFAVNDGPGIRTTVFLKGCPLKCCWCHNPESQQPEPQSGKPFQHKSNLKLFRESDLIGNDVSVDEVVTEINKDIIFYDESGGGVTFSGGEPLMQENFLTALLQACRVNAIHIVVDTCGYAPYSVFQKINPLVDLYLFDLKIIDDADHLKYTGISNFSIFKNLSQLIDDQKNIRLRFPLIPGITDTKENLNQMIEFIQKLKMNLPLDLLPYNKIAESKYDRLHLENRLRKLEQQTPEKLAAIKSQFSSAGINVS